MRSILATVGRIGKRIFSWGGASKSVSYGKRPINLLQGVPESKIHEKIGFQLARIGRGKPGEYGYRAGHLAGMKDIERAFAGTSEFSGMSRGGAAQKSRRLVSEGLCTGRKGCACAACRGELGFGSPWRGIVNPAKILSAIQKRYGRIWENTAESFVKQVKSGTRGVEFAERDVTWARGSLEQAQAWQKGRGGIKPGFQEFTMPAKGGLPERQFIAYNTMLGQTVAVGSMQKGVSGELIRRHLVVAEEFRGKGLAPRISRKMFEAGAIETVTLSTPGAKAYHKMASMLAEEAGMKTVMKSVPNVPVSDTLPSRGAVRRAVHANQVRATMKVHAAQSYQTTPLLSSSVHGNRGSRGGRRGGNG